MTQSTTSRSGAVRRNLQALAIVYLIAGVLIALVTAGLVLFNGSEMARALPLTMMGVGVLLMLTGGNALERVTTLESSRWGISVNRHREQLGKEYSDVGELTSLGMALLVGVPLIGIGSLLF